MTLSHSISASERQVLRVIWANPKCTSTYIIEALSKNFNWQAATIKTLINRLLKKEFIITTSKRPYQYVATLTEEKLLDLECDDLLTHVCQKRQGELLSLLIQKAQLSKQDTHLLQKLLQEKEIDAPEQLACTCIPGQCRCCHH
ncbi:BlaI/MecI/CopY family transcriptional regulator [uncultured Granulicatella sp.]|uniref:BlaI/MecI/CopY family transcriptional regulator n=1 Tax=uncultured Granulicatella sp. TaxID=316089 RepID=UPI0028D23A1B|nr:BlaI/MecI/CopY family transcriptional regulator [uncultured Granulicatella sp.]